MKLSIMNISPKRLLKSKKSHSISRSEVTSSFSSGTTSDSFESSSNLNLKSRDISDKNGSATPVSVLPGQDWSDVLSELVYAFKLIDGDGDGKIRTEDLETLLNRVGTDPPSKEEMRVLLSDLDGDGDGCINFEDLGPISSVFGPPSCSDELRVAFDFFDADRDGKISAEELFNAFSSFGNGRCTLEDCRRMISGVDKNGDGFVCFEDFSRMMEQQAA